MIKERHRTCSYDITTRLESFSLNTVISGFMEYNNKLIEIAKKEGGIDKETLETDRSPAFSICTSFCRGDCGSSLDIQRQSSKQAGRHTMRHEMKDDEIEVPVQINGKTKAVISVSQQISPKKMRSQQEKKRSQIN